jgi:hypothetical protein
MTESDIYINKIIEPRDSEPPQNWEIELRKKKDPEFIEEYISLLSWLREDQTSDNSDIEVGEQQRISDVYQVLTEEAKKRVKKLYEESQLPEAFYIQKLCSKGILTPDEIGSGSISNDVLNFLILKDITEHKEKSQIDFTITKRKKRDHTLKMISSAAALTLLTTLISNQIHQPTINSQSENEATHGITTNTSVAQKEPPPPPPTPTETLIEKDGGYFISQTATVLPPQEHTTAVRTETFTKEDIRELKQSAYKIELYANQEKKPNACTVTMIARNDTQIALLLARHCFVNFMGEDYTINYINKIRLVNPETGETSDIYIDQDSLIYTPAENAPDVAILIGNLKNKDFKGEPFPLERILPDYIPPVGTPYLVTGYPEMLYAAEPKFLVGEGQKTATYKNTKMVSSVSNKVLKAPILNIVATPTASGASGGSDASKIKDQIYITGVNSVELPGAITKQGVIMRRPLAGVAPIPEEFLNQVRARMNIS